MENFLANSFLGNSVKDWLIALGIALGAIVVARTLYWVMENYIKKLTEKTETKIDDILINTVERPMVAARRY